LGFVNCPSSKQIFVSTSVFLAWVDAKHQTFFEPQKSQLQNFKLQLIPKNLSHRIDNILCCRKIHRQDLFVLKALSKLYKCADFLKKT
jgi:hypothetical protein